MQIGTKPTKRNWKFRIFTAFLTGLLFVGIMSLLDYWLDGSFQSIYSYLFQGILFGILMEISLPYITGKLVNKAGSRLGKNIKPELTDNETVEIEGPANLFRGIEGVGGKLFLTNKKVIFKSHKINIQNGQTDIEYNDIAEIIKRKTAKLIDNGIRVKTNEGKEFDFVVNDRDKWIEELNERISVIQ